MWSSANIREKGDEVVPFWIDGDASAAIIFIVSNVRIFTAAMHSSPCTIFGAWVWPKVTFAVFIISTGATFVRSITGFSGTIFSSKISSRDYRLIPAIALAEPKDIATGSFANWTECDQSPKSDVCDIYRFCGHRTAPSVQMSSGGIGVAASIPLRIVAGGLLRCLQ